MYTESDLKWVSSWSMISSANGTKYANWECARRRLWDGGSEQACVRTAQRLEMYPHKVF